MADTDCLTRPAGKRTGRASATGNHAGGRHVKALARLLHVRFGPAGDAPAPGVVWALVAESRASGPATDRSPPLLEPLPVGLADEHARLEPDRLRDSHLATRRYRAADRHPEELWHHQQYGSTVESSAPGRDSAGRSRGTNPGLGAAVTVFDENQKVARVRESGRGTGFEVTERDRDDDRDRADGVIDPAARSQHDRGSNLHRRCRTGGVSRPNVSIYTPSHTSTYCPVPAKSLHINPIPTQHTTPRCRTLGQGDVGERPCRIPAVFGPGRCSSVTPAAPGRSPRNRPSGKGPLARPDRRCKRRSRGQPTLIPALRLTHGCFGGGRA